MGTLGAQGSDIPGLYNVTNSKVVNAEIAQMTNTLMSFNAKLGMNAASYVGTSGVKLSTLDTSANIIRKMGMVTMYKKTIAIVKEACKVYMLGGDAPTANQAAIGNV